MWCTHEQKEDCIEHNGTKEEEEEQKTSSKFVWSEDEAKLFLSMANELQSYESS